MDKLSKEERRLISLYRSTTDWGREIILICAKSAQIYNEPMANEIREKQSV
jgi:hypothetical protein